MALLGLDLGTSRVKAVVCAADGRVLGEGQHGYPMDVGLRGWAETSTGAWWEASVGAVRQALSEVREPVECMAVVGQMHGVVLTDRSGAALRPAVLWSDSRTGSEVATFRSLPDELLAELGNEPVAGMAGCSLLWLKRHEPECYSAARWALQPKDWLCQQLTGRAGSEPSDASGTLLFALRDRRWASEVVRAIGIDGRLLAPLGNAGEMAGPLVARAADRLGLPAGVPVATGAGDTASALVAAGLEGEGDMLLSLGTGGQFVVRERRAPEGVARFSNVYCAADQESSWYRLGAAQNVGLALDWVRGLLGATWEEVYEACCEPVGPHAPLFVPYLVGERWETRAGGSWCGLGVEHGPRDLLAAALEGVAFLLRLRLDDLRWNGVPSSRVLLAGGGAQSKPWRDYLLGIIGLPACLAGAGSLSARGAVLLAGVANGTYKTLQEARTTVPAPVDVEASGEELITRERYERFLELVGRARPGM